MLRQARPGVRGSSDNTITGKNIAIIGDSYSTYYGWIPDGYSSWYAADGVDGHNTAENDVNSVEQTWWKQMINEKGYNLLVNSSYSGSCVCNTTFGGGDGTATSFITRAAKDLEGKNPDTIYIFGGTNDSGAGCPVGSLKYSDWTTDDLKQVLPAVCYLIDWNKTNFPNAEIVWITNGFVGTYGEMYISQEIRDGIASACTHYGVKNILVEGKEGTECTNIHPNQTGMVKIKDTIVADM